MIRPNPLNLRHIICSSASHVFATMLAMKVHDGDAAPSLSAIEERIVASIGFGGNGVAGGLAISVTSQFAGAITATLLGSPPHEVHDPSAVNDVMAELANVLGGNCLAALAEHGHQCALSLPSVTRGVGLQTNTIRGAKRECVTFEHESNWFFISLDLKAREP